MIIFDPGNGEPLNWVVCFSRQAATPWLTRIPFIGKYKHVRAFGCVRHINTWIFFDPAVNRTSIKVARGDAVRPLMEAFLYCADAVLMPTREPTSLRPKIFGWCVPAVAQALGLSSGALRPDTLFRDCLRQGGVILTDGRIEPTPAAAD